MEWMEDVKRSDGERMNDEAFDQYNQVPFRKQTAPATYLKMPSIIQSASCQSVNQLINIDIATCQVQITYTWNESWC